MNLEPLRRHTSTPFCALKISIDFDGTMWQHMTFFREFMWAMKAAGHSVGCLTGHKESLREADISLMVERGFPVPDFWIGRPENSEEHGGAFKPRMIETHGIDIHFDDLDFSNETTIQLMGANRKVFKVNHHHDIETKPHVER